MFASGTDSAVADAVEYLTSFSVNIGEDLLKDWFTFFGQLFVKYRDGFVTVVAPEVPVCGCLTNSAPYQDTWYNRIASDTGSTYVVPAEDSIGESAKRRQYRVEHPSIPKTQLRALQ